MNPILVKQLACDFCMSESEITDNNSHFTIFRANPERRVFKDTENCFLKAASVNGKILATGEKSIIQWCEEKFVSFIVKE